MTYPRQVKINVPRFKDSTIVAMIPIPHPSSPARWKAYSFARWLVLCVFLVAATFTVEALETGSTLAKLHAPTTTSELAAAERKAAETP